MNRSALEPAVIQRNRALFGLTQAQAARLVHVTTQTWYQWEANKRSMHPAFHELFLIKAARLGQDGGQKG